MTDGDDNVISLLRRTRFVEGLSPEIIRSLAGTAKVLELPAGTVLFTEGSHQDLIYVVVEGNVAIEMQVPRRGRVRLLTVGPGDLVGWSGLVSDGIMTSTAVVTEDAVLLALSSRQLLDVIRNDHEFGYLLMSRTAAAIASRLLATRLQLLDLYSETEPRTGRPD